MPHFAVSCINDFHISLHTIIIINKKRFKQFKQSNTIKSCFIHLTTLLFFEGGIGGPILPFILYKNTKLNTTILSVMKLTISTLKALMLYTIICRLCCNSCISSSNFFTFLSSSTILSYFYTQIVIHTTITLMKDKHLQPLPPHRSLSSYSYLQLHLCFHQMTFFLYLLIFIYTNSVSPHPSHLITIHSKLLKYHLIIIPLPQTLLSITFQ